MGQTLSSNRTSKLQIGKALSDAWNKVSGYKTTIFLAALLIFIPYIALLVGENFYVAHLAYQAGITLEAFQTTHTFYIVLASFITILQVYFMFCFGALIHLSLRKTKNLPVKTRMIFDVFKDSRLFKLLGLIIFQLLACAALPYALIFGAYMTHQTHQGALSLIFILIVISYMVLGLIYGYRFLLAIPIIMDRNLNVWPAIKLSFQKTKGNWWRFFGLFWITFGIYVLGCLTLYIGLIWAGPYCLNIIAETYDQLVGIQNIPA